MVSLARTSKRSVLRFRVPKVVLEATDIASRYEACRHLLLPLVERKSTGGPAIDRAPRYGGIAYAAHGGSPAADIRQWRFRTCHPSFAASYLETWIPTDRALRHYFLRSASLAIYRALPSRHGEAEFVALHCEPNEPSTASGSAYIYKRSPHLHIEAAEFPIPKSHISLAHPFLDTILQSEASLFVVLRLAIEMLRDEVLERA